MEGYVQLLPDFAPPVDFPGQANTFQLIKFSSMQLSYLSLLILCGQVRSTTETDTPFSWSTLELLHTEMVSEVSSILTHPLLLKVLCRLSWIYQSTYVDPR